LVHFALDVDVDRAIFGAMVGFIVVVHVVQGSWCVWSSASPATSIRSSTLLVALRGLWLRILEFEWCEDSLQPLFQFSDAIVAMYRLYVAIVAIVVAWP
jgi:hypothetical protein